MPARENNIQRLKAQRPDFSDTEDAYTGRILDTGVLDTLPTNGAEAGRIWVHSLDRRNNRQVKNAIEIFNKRSGKSVKIGRNIKTDQYEVMRPNASIPDEVPGGDSVVDTAILRPENFGAGYVLPNADYPNSLNAFISPFKYPGGSWEGDNLLLVPTATSASKSWCCIGVNMVTGLAVQVFTADVPDVDTYTMHLRDVDSILVAYPDVAWRSAVVLVNGDIDFTNRRFYSIGQWGVSRVKHNYEGSSAPTVDDDETQGYSIGSEWYHGADIYDCTSAGVGAAVWTLRGSGGGGGGSSLASDKKKLTSGNKTITGTTFADLDAALDITLITGAHRCWVSWTLSCVPGTGQSQVDVEIDGTLVSGAAYGLIEAGGSGQNRNLSGTHLTDILTAASHTFKLFVRVDGGSSTYYASTAANPAILSVVELYA